MGYEVVISYDNVQSVLAQSGTAVVGNLVYGIAAFAVMVLILAIGYAIAWVLGKALKEFSKQIKVEQFMEKHGVHDSLLGFNLTGIAVLLVKLWVMVVFLGISAQITNVGLILDLSTKAIDYMPMLIEGVILLVVGLVVADYITDRMKTVKKIPFVNGIAMVIEVFIIYVAAVMALPLMLPTVKPDLLENSFNIVLTAVCFSVGLGLAIAMGLGLKDAVADVAKKHKDKIGRLF